MTLTPPAPPPRPNRGCLWGCLAVLAFLFVPALLAAGYGAWFFYQGYMKDPVLHGVVALVRHDGMAEMALGEDIHVTGVEGSVLSFMGGESGSYVLDLAGSKGAGALHVTAKSVAGKLTVQSMILEGPGGSRYDLLHHIAVPGAGGTQSI